MEVKQVVSDAHSEPIISITYNPFQQKLFTGSEDGTIKIWDTTTGKEEKILIKHEGWVTDILFCERYNYLFSCSLDGTLVAWNSSFKPFYENKVLETSENTHFIQIGIPCSCLSWDPKKKILVVSLKDTISFFKLKRNRYDQEKKLLEPITTAQLQQTTDFVKCMSASDNRLVCGTFDACIYMFENNTGRQVLRINKAHKATVSAISYDRDNTRIISGSFDKSVKIWNLDGSLIFQIDGFIDMVTGLCYNQITKTIWVSANSVHPLIFDSVTGNEITDYVSGIAPPSSVGTIQQLKFLPSTSEIVGTSSSKGFVIWKHNPFTPLATIKSGSDVVETLSLNYSKTGLHVFSGGGDNTIRRWEVKDLDAQIEPGESYSGHRDSVLTSFFYEPLEILVTGSGDKTVRIWSYDSLPKTTTSDQRRRPAKEPAPSTSPKPPNTLAQIEAYGMSWLNRKICGMDHRYILEGHTDRVTSLVCFQAQGFHNLISVSWDSNIILWDLNRDTHHMRKVIPSGHEDFILDVAYSPETGDFATCSGNLCYEEGVNVIADSTIKLWSFASLKLVATLEGHTAEVTKVLWNRIIVKWVSASDDGSIRIWDEIGQPYTVIHNPGGGISALGIDTTFGYVLAASSLDHIIRVYDIFAETIVQENVGHTDVITDIKHASQSKFYLSCSWDQTVRVWMAVKERGIEDGTSVSNQPSGLRRDSFEEETAERFQISIKAADSRIARDWNKVSTNKTRKDASRLPPKLVQEPRRSLGHQRTKPEEKLKFPPVPIGRFSV